MRSKWFWGVLLLTLLATLYVQIPTFADLYRTDDDLRQYFWMARFQDPDVFPGDPIIDDIKRVHTIDVLGFELVCQFESLGFSVIYQLASYLIPPLILNKILPLIVMAICVAYLFALGRELRDSERWASFLVLSFVLFSLSVSPNSSPLTGLERSFQFVLLTMFMYYFVIDLPLGLIVTLVVQVLIYTPMFVVSVMAYAVSLIRWEGGRLGIDLRMRRIWPLLVGVALAMLVLLPALTDSRVVTVSLGEEGEQVPLWQNPNYGPSGRVPIFPKSFSGFPSFLLAGYGGLAPADSWWHLTPLIFLTVIILVCVGTKSLRIDRRIHSLLLGSLVAWLLVWLGALTTGHFVLRYPFKYTNAPFPLWMLFYCTLNGSQFVDTCARVFRSKSRKWLVVWAGGAVSILGSFFIKDELAAALVKILGALTFIGGAAGLLFWRMREGAAPPGSTSGKSLRIAWVAYILVLLLVFVPRMKSYTVAVPLEERPLLDYVAALPKDVLIAGDPEVMSNIPLFAKRSVFFSSEISYVGQTRVDDFYSAYYADRPEDVYAFCEEYGVDYLVVNRGHFLEDYLAAAQFFYSPYNEYIVDLVAGRTAFFLASIPNDEVEFTSGRLFVWRCSAKD